jgi:hypothetical protein
MAPYSPAILAAGDDDFARVIVPVVIAIIWGLGALINAAKKKQKEAEERRRHGENWQRIEQEMRQRAAQAQSVLTRPPPLPYQPPQPQPPPPPPPVFAPTRSIEGPYVPPRPVQRPVPPRPVPQPVSRPPARKSKKKALKPPPPMPVEEPVERATTLTPAAPMTSARPAPTAGADAAALSRWLNARTLRSQFILTEILQPPLALRDPSDRAGA